MPQTAEQTGLQDDGRNWKRRGPNLSERQWGTVREDYSAGGKCLGQTGWTGRAHEGYSG